MEDPFSSSILLIIEFIGLGDELQSGDVETGDDVGFILPGVLLVVDRLRLLFFVDIFLLKTGIIFLRIFPEIWKATDTWHIITGFHSFLQKKYQDNEQESSFFSRVALIHINC